MNKDYINYMTFSHLCYILVREKRTLVRVKLQVNQEQRCDRLQCCWRCCTQDQLYL